MQILAVGIRGKQLKRHTKLRTEIIAYIRNDLLFSRGCKAGHRNRILKLLFLLILTDKVADIKVINTKILSPCRKAMRLVDNEPNHIARKQ